MRKLGLIGGMSWVSTRTYYSYINSRVQARRDRRSSAPMLIDSLDFSELYALQAQDDWDRATSKLIESAQRLEQAGAGALIIGANSMHRVYDRVAESVSVPILHIADCVGKKMVDDGITNAAVIGTSNVMTESFFRQRLVAHGIDLLPPEMDNVQELDRIIYEELMVGKATRDAQRKLKTMITVKEQEGAKAIVLACTELEQIVDVDANVLPIYDTTHIHAMRAAEWILGQD
ncbi:aspartate/glutamate racemase family protein [Altericroceibacterium endophyticum]|uniref:Amino acid racemase n=1 Tax=Altericroceibacterium endophyticum TaxID=1808508 RepID=A0A6I4T1Y0_9SPHN|nr:amino acid racemase [Altericroceibacterium endophyticum]MXO64241.1 amino acid racemase [Altericroceibacterium endophyticum]